MEKNRFNLSRTQAWVLGTIVVLLALMVAVPYLLNIGPLRTYMEHQMNSRLTGYTVTIQKASFHPISFAVDLRGLTLKQDANPEPPVATIARLRAKVHWREIITAHLVGDFLIEQPKIYINLKNIHSEQKSDVAFKEKGWQEALQSIYPLKINVFTVNSGSLTYIDKGPSKPLSLTDVHMMAHNIRNIRYREDVYPSPVQMAATIFGRGKVSLDGRANFLLEPHAGFKGEVALDDMDISYFKPITGRRNIIVHRGIMAGKGEMEYSPKKTEVNLETLSVTGVELDYVHLPGTAEKEKARLHATAETAKELSNEPTAQLRIGTLKIQGSMGYIDKTSAPQYRLFFDPLDFTMKNFSNQFSEGEATIDLRGKFMGTGDTKITGTFRPETKTPDFSLNIAIENTSMPAMSDLFRAYGNFDIKEGLFSFYSEMRVRGSEVEGYIKPLFKDMKVYDRRQYKDKNLFHKIYVGLVGGIAKLLQNPPRKEVATKTTISGPLESPSTSTAQVITNLIRNAFIKAILPGFEKEVTRPGK